MPPITTSAHPNDKNSKTSPSSGKNSSKTSSTSNRPTSTSKTPGDHKKIRWLSPAGTLRWRICSSRSSRTGSSSPWTTIPSTGALRNRRSSETGCYITVLRSATRRCSAGRIRWSQRSVDWMWLRLTRSTWVGAFTTSCPFDIFTLL